MGVASYTSGDLRPDLLLLYTPAQTGRDQTSSCFTRADRSGAGGPLFPLIQEKVSSPTAWIYKPVLSRLLTKDMP